MIQKLKILFVASEMAPFAQVGGLGDVLGSLSKFLSQKGVKVGVIIPKYEIIGQRRGLKLLFKNFEIPISREKISLYRLKEKGVEIFFVENKKYLSQGPVYFQHTAFAGSFKEIQRFLFFSFAVFELLKSGRLPFKANIIHANDWHTGALVSLIKNSGFPLKTIFTIHNLENQGKWKEKIVTKWFGPNEFQKRDKNFNFIAEGIRNADVLTTVSPTYAKEIQTKRYGMGLEKIIKARKRKIIGILNGIDYSFYNPSIDPFLFFKYSKAGLDEFKEKNKIALQKKCGLAMNKNKPLFGLVSRLTEQKGIGLIIPLIEQLTKKHNAQFIFLGLGEKRYENALIKAARKNPKNVFAKIGFDEKLAHQIYAGADFFLMPSIFEPCGLGQMIAMRYATIPICRKTGGLKDSVKDNKTGFLFEKPLSRSLQKAIEKGLKLFQNEAELKNFRKRCLKENFSWENQTSKSYDFHFILLKILKGSL